MRRKLIAQLVPVVLAMSAVAASAQPAAEDDSPFNARLVGYNAAEGQPAGPVVIKPVSGTTGTWFVVAILGVITFGVMCKNPKRTHLD